MPTNANSRGVIGGTPLIKGLVHLVPCGTLFISRIVYHEISRTVATIKGLVPVVPLVHQKNAIPESESTDLTLMTSRWIAISP